MKGLLTVLLCFIAMYSYATPLDTILPKKPLVTDSILSQKKSIGTKGGAEGYFRVNYNKLDFSKLNNAFAGSAWKMPSTPTISIGGGGNIILGHWVLGGEGQTLLKQTQKQSGTTNTYNTYYGGGYGLFNIGYTVIAKKWILLYPMLGIGGGHIYTEIDETPSNTDFVANANTQPVEAHYQNKTFMLNPKLCIDFMVKGFLIGVEGGYNYMTGNNWTINKTKLSSAPSSNLNGIYAGITIGIGGLK